MDHFKTIEFVITLLLLYVLFFWPQIMWDLTSLTRDRTLILYIRRRSLNPWTAREVPILIAYLIYSSLFGIS